MLYLGCTYSGVTKKRYLSVSHLIMQCAEIAVEDAYKLSPGDNNIATAERIASILWGHDNIV